MDERVVSTLRYAKQELAEIDDLIQRGLLNEQGAYVRLFMLGKVLVGWDDEESELEQFEYLRRANQSVKATLNEMIRRRAS